MNHSTGLVERGLEIYLIRRKSFIIKDYMGASSPDMDFPPINAGTIPIWLGNLVSHPHLLHATFQVLR